MRDVIMWGQHVDEYQHMFSLNLTDLNGRLLEWGCGATAVNAQLNAQQRSIISCDPLFSFEGNSLIQEVELYFNDAVKEISAGKSHYDFSDYGSFHAFIEKRRQGIDLFFADYERGRDEKRYLPLILESLPFSDFSFDIALSSSYLFSDPEKSVDFHLQCIRELARVAKEVRIFPLVDKKGQPSPILGPVLLALQQANFAAEIREVNYRLHVNGDAMLKVWARECQV